MRVHSLPPTESGTPKDIPATNADDLEKRFDLLREATQREREHTATRASANQTRATLLLGATGIVASIEGGSGLATGGALGQWALALLAVAVLFGIWALVPTRADAVPVEEIGQHVTAYAATVDLKQTLWIKEVAADDAAAQIVKRRSWLVNGGFIALAFGVGLSVISGWEANAAKSIEPTPTPTPIQIEIVR